MNKAKVSKNIVVGKAGKRNLEADLYLPQKHSEKRPALVIIHGGGWHKGSTNGVKGFGLLLSRSGFVCLCPSYRLSPEAPWPAQLEDIKCSIRYLRKNCERLGIDPNRIGAVGDSAGGHLALMTALETRFEGKGGYAKMSSSIKAVASLYGPTRIQYSADGGNLLMGPKATEQDYRSASPLTYCLKEFPPCLLIHGSQDTAVPLSESMKFYEKLESHHRKVELHVFSDESHAFDRRSWSEEKMVDVGDPSSIYGKTVIDIIDLFFTKHL
ncbi:MAG: alpha/beta hydrolase fold domain-containing protein [Candidatus Azotimanducaceae bacterium]|uniref:Alpha/beta hydrolase n=1 Tax=OM182 bacterium TaxID=2510334 RepID=A0A520S331_9GAMM|nr:MAG: alpha/beta hydrolase [OM182 bacterium]